MEAIQDLAPFVQGGMNKVKTQQVVDWVGFDEERMEQLVELFVAGPWRVTQSCAWPLSVIAEKHTALVLPHLETLVQKAADPQQHVAVKRNVIRLLQFVELPEHLLGIVAELCFNTLSNASEAVAPRVFSMTVLLHICQQLPELREELQLIIEDHLPYGTAGFQSRGRKVLKALARLGG